MPCAARRTRRALDGRYGASSPSGGKVRAYRPPAVASHAIVKLPSPKTTSCGALPTGVVTRLMRVCGPRGVPSAVSVRRSHLERWRTRVNHCVHERKSHGHNRIEEAHARAGLPG